MRRLGTRGLLLAAVPLVFEIAFAMVVIVMERSETREEADELRRKEIVASSYHLMSLLVDTETGIRGYVITGEPRFTEPYDRAMREVPGELRRLRTLTAGFGGLEALVPPILEDPTTQRDRVAGGNPAGGAAGGPDGNGEQEMDEIPAPADPVLAAGPRHA